MSRSLSSSAPRDLLRLAAFVLLLIGLTVAYRASASPVLLDTPMGRLPQRTHARTVGEFLRGRTQVRPGDRVWPTLDSPIVAGMTITFRPARRLSLQVDADLTSMDSAAPFAEDILMESGTPTFPGDRIWADGIPLSASPGRPVSPRERVRLEMAREITLEIDGRPMRIRSAAATLGEALWQAGIEVRHGDRVSPLPSTPMSQGLRAVVVHGEDVAIQVEGKVLRARAAGETVGDVLAAVGILPVGLDYAVPSPEADVPANGRLRLVRVVEELKGSLEPLAFGSDFQPDDELEIDHQRLVSPGLYGVVADTARVRFEDGSEAGRFGEGRRVVREPEPRVVGYGTRIVLRSVNTPDGELQYWRAVTMFATAYSPCHSAADRCYPNTSSGKPVQKGVVAVVLRWYRVMRGLPVYIPGYGFATIEDVGGGIPGQYWIDLGYSDSDIVSWNRWVTVYFLAPVPSPDRIYWVLD